MPTVQKSLRIRLKTLRLMQEMARERDTDFSTVANELLDEATRMRRCPGIVFAQGPTGPRARIAGTGIDVWEVVATHKSLKRNFGRLQKAYPQLSERQLLAALTYYRRYQAEIEGRLRANHSWTPARVRARLPLSAGEIR
jgi:uncharacterized protein (DUF433 family)